MVICSSCGESWWALAEKSAKWHHNCVLLH